MPPAKPRRPESKEPAMTPALVPVTLANTATLPEGGSIALGLALCAGLTLWLFGAKLVKPVFLFLGLAIGGFVGATLVPYIDFIGTIHILGIGITPGITGLIAGGVIGALIALAMFRMVVTLTAALAFAAAGLMCAFLFLHFYPTQGSETDLSIPTESLVESEDSPNLVDQFREEVADRYVDSLAAGGEGQNELLTEEAKQQILDAAARSRAFVSRVGSAIRDDFNTRPARDKFVILSAMFAGLGLGLLVGAVIPVRTAALVTSLFGSAVWMSSGIALLTARGNPPGFLDQKPVVLAGVWIIVTILGLLAQLGFLSKAKAMRSKRAEDDDDE
ncbi:MAG: hypothetical protein KC996_10155 [Phycisphaerales bacterium]|nr:hypothetical protein [Phycisphaerales bacterium]